MWTKFCDLEFDKEDRAYYQIGERKGEKGNEK
jgi:hypothetical protein